MSYPNGARSRFGFRFTSHQTPVHPQTGFPLRDYECKPQTMAIEPDGGTVAAKTTTTTTVEESSYRVQPNSPNAQPHPAGERRTGFPEGFFRRPKPAYGTTQPALMTNDGWARPSPAGWKLPPEAPLENATIEVIDPAAAERSRETTVATAAPPLTRSRWAPPGWKSEFGGKRASGTIDSREAVRRYGGQYI
ncbi:proline-rich receptor-like protein kinase PERK9 [Iris pallida]|uniref:Proline-rich receptor-like protein kinase PERK9 n=1 Tax=Iris pallida TaxID=29817 RepID=A0AAX6DWK0_IRIPA|nr:proline-rich receptor-like protein kinase PERK9 [Iris pallida]